MSKLKRRDFLCCLSVASIFPFIGENEVSAQVKNMKLTSPVHGATYTWVGGPVECRLMFRKKQAYPRIVRVDYRANGVLIGSGFPHANANQNFYYSWAIPIPSTQGDNYTLRAEAIQVRTGNVVGTDSVDFRIIRLQG
jgi:hypothetical protein